MSKRSMTLDDRLLSEMIWENISSASKMNMDMLKKFSARQQTYISTIQS